MHAGLFFVVGDNDTTGVGPPRGITAEGKHIGGVRVRRGWGFGQTTPQARTTVGSTELFSLFFVFCRL